MAEVERVIGGMTAESDHRRPVAVASVVGKNAEILDVGCGTGDLTESLTCFGSVVGCDPSDLAISRIKQGHAEGMKPEEICGSQGGCAVLICSLFDVLEHAPSDLALLQDYLPEPQREGVVMITVPAWNCFWGDHDMRPPLPPLTPLT